MFAVTVLFRIKPDQMAAFLPLMTENARRSKDVEPGCRQFDICVDAERDTVFLYEIYDDRAAFDAHLNSDHFRAFDNAVAELVQDKEVRLFDEVLQ